MKLDFTQDERKLIVEGLAELPLKVSYELYNILKDTVDVQSTFTFTGTLNDINIIIPALGELKANRSFMLISKINDAVIAGTAKEDLNGDTSLQGNDPGNDDSAQESEGINLQVEEDTREVV